MAPSTQKALVLETKFGKFNLHMTPVPKPGPGEILIKIKSTALNPVDWKIQKYSILTDKYPAIISVDIAGDVKEIATSEKKSIRYIPLLSRVWFQNYLSPRLATSIGVRS